MTRLLSWLLGRLPVGWLQLTYNKSRLLAAIAGVAFANVLVLVQLGILGAFNAGIISTYDFFDADILISAEDANTLSEGGNVPRQRMFQALAVPGVDSACPLFLGNLTWNREDGSQIAFQVIGVDPTASGFLNAEIASKIPELQLPDTAVVDAKTRGLAGDEFEDVSPDRPVRLELQGREIRAINAIHSGGSFGADGTMIVSDQTFLRFFRQRTSRAPDHVFVNVAPGTSPHAVVERLERVLPPELRVRTLADAAVEDQLFQTTERPTGLIFGFGVVIGVIVGVIIVYQILSTDVADHLREYATFKAMGYEQSFFVGIILEEALVLAVLGFIPGLLVSWGIYALLSAMTGLPVAMVASRAVSVFLGTAAACSLSGAAATRKLAGSDPADLF